MSEVRVVAAVLVEAGRVLVARRGPGMSQAGLWELPGGKVEPGESDAAALEREIAEELGLDIVAGASLAESPFRAGGRALRLVAVAARLRGGQLRLLEHAEVAWVGAAALDGLDWCPPDRPLLAAVRAELDRVEQSA